MWWVFHHFIGPLRLPVFQCKTDVFPRHGSSARSYGYVAAVTGGKRHKGMVTVVASHLTNLPFNEWAASQDYQLRANLKIIEQLQSLYAQIQSVQCRVCVWQPQQTWVSWSVSPFYSSVPSQLQNPREDGLVFLSSLPNGEPFQSNCVNLALFY